LTRYGATPSAYRGGTSWTRRRTNESSRKTAGRPHRFPRV
jgi:hypothetical protein